MSFLSGPRSRSEHQRSGAAHVLIAAMMLTFMIVAAMIVDFAYMQLIRTELRTAADAAAKAGAEALTRTQDGNQARAAAVQYAALNKVGNRPYAISTNDVTLGRVTGQANGSWTFTANATPPNSVRVNAKVGHGGTTAAIPTFFAPALGYAPFATSSQATAGQQTVEVCLCIDRSGSMMWDMSGHEWSYPSPNPLLHAAWRYPDSLQRNYCSPPQTTASRWAIVLSAVGIFLNEAGQFPHPPRTSLVTWSSALTLSYFPNTSYTLVDTDYGLPAEAGFNWSTNRNAVESALANRSSNAIAGGTTMSAGIDRAVSVLTGANSLPLSNKIIILLTDGQWNAGRNPVLAAQDAAAAGIRIHCVSMITSSQPTLTNVANITGGQYYATSNSAQLQAAFQDLARNLPIVLTD
jgi:Ca-activated chloride channel family protein